MKPADIERVFGRGRLKMMTGEHVEVFREEAAPGERRRYTKRFLSTTEGDFRHWTEREWRILARLVGHGIGVVPDVVQFDRGNRDRPALVQTYDAGITVDHWATLLPVERDGTVLRHMFEDCAHWWALAQHCLIALDTIHELDLVHLDLKADNVCIPFGPTDFDPHAPDQLLRPLFPQISLIDFAFSLVSGERLANALPIGHQTEDEYQSPRLLRALEAGRHGDLQPTRDLDWRCDLFSLAAMLNRYLPPTPFIAGGWTGACHRKAQSLICRLYDAHHEPLPSTRPHRQFIASTEQVLGDPALAASLERGWLLALESELSPIDTPTPVTRIAVPVAAVTTDLFAGVASAPLVPPRPRRRIAPWAWGTAVVATGALSVPLMSGDWAPWRSSERVATAPVLPAAPPREAKPVVASTLPRAEPAAAAPAAPNPPATRTASAEPALKAGAEVGDTPAAPPAPVDTPAPSHVATPAIDPAPAKPAAPTRATAPHTAVAKAAPSSTTVATAARSTRHAHAAKPAIAAKSTTLAKSAPSRAHAAPATVVAAAAPAAARSIAAAAPSAPIAARSPAPAFAMAALPPRDNKASTTTAAAPSATPAPAAATPAPAPSPVIAAATPAPPPAAPPVALVSAAPSAISTGPSGAARPALLLSDDFSERAEELLTQHLPRIAQRAERMVLRVLHIAAESDTVGQERDVRDAARLVHNASDDALSGITTSTIEARRLKEAAANAFWSERNARRASTLQARAFGADPLDAETAGDLAFYLLKQRPAPAEIARELALYALTTSQGNAPSGRLQDWTSFAIASALTGRQRDASNALYVTLALSDSVDRACRSALAAYASHGERLRAPTEAMLYRIQSWGRSGESTFCRWPPSWSGAMRGQ